MLTEPRLDRLSETVLKRRYLARNDEGEIIETPAQMFSRVAAAVAEADRIFDPSSPVERITADFEDAMASLLFLPNTPCLVNAGRPRAQLAACFVLPLEDNLGSIFQTLKDTALVHQTGGGTGFSFSRIRPRGDTIFPAFGVSGGPVSFVRLFDSATYLIDRNQIRPGANMGVLDATHPDIEEFICAKASVGEMENFNLSVAAGDRFIHSLKQGGSYELIHPRTGAVADRKPAAEILELIAQTAWGSGDPGLLFIDRINRDNPVPGQGRIEATNPCGEQPLLPYESCTLGSVNLSKLVKNGEPDFPKIDRIVRLAVHFLDNVVEINRYPLPAIEHWSRLNRKIGLGVMGFADALILMGVSYQSDRAISLAERIMERIRGAAAAASAELARTRGNFPAFDSSVFPDSGVKFRRNASLTTIAPTGSISLIAGTSSGIEPVFAFEMNRRLIDSDFQQVHPIYKEYQDEGRLVPREIFMTAWDVSPQWHLKIQEAFQKHTDSAVSKTVNFSAEATVEDIRRLFLEAAESEVKGVTVYRDRSRDDQTLTACPVRCQTCG